MTVAMVFGAVDDRCGDDRGSDGRRDEWPSRWMTLAIDYRQGDACRGE